LLYDVIKAVIESVAEIVCSFSVMLNCLIDSLELGVRLLNRLRIKQQIFVAYMLLPRHQSKKRISFKKVDALLKNTGPYFIRF